MSARRMFSLVPVSIALAFLAGVAMPCLTVPVMAQDESESADTGEKKVTNTPVRDKWALIVGISKFKNKDIPTLKYAAKDARDFYTYLTKEAGFAPDHVRMLLDEDATERRILSELGSKFLARVANPDDLVVLFFSTHGSPAQLDVRGRNFLVANDTDPNDLYATGIKMKEICDEVTDSILSKRVLLLLDACHSGSVDPNAKGIHRVGNFDAKALSLGSGRMVICSSLPDEQSWESKRYENGVFTRNLIKGLRSKGTGASIDDAFKVMKDSVEEEVREDYKGNHQTPVMHNQWEGDELILAVRPVDPQKIPDTVMEELELDSSPENMVKRERERRDNFSQSSLRSKDTLELTQKYFSDVPNPTKAYTEACAAVAAHFNEPDFYYRKALIQIQLGKFAGAMQTLKGCIVDNPQKAEYWLARAYCFHKMGEEGLAQGDIRTAQFRNPLLPKQIVFGD